MKSSVGMHDAHIRRRGSVAPGDLSLGTIPSISDCIHNSEGTKVLKLCGDSDWQPRFLALTSDKIIIAHPGQSEISDQIPLVSRS